MYSTGEYITHYKHFLCIIIVSVDYNGFQNSTFLCSGFRIEIIRFRLDERLIQNSWGKVSEAEGHTGILFSNKSCLFFFLFLITLLHLHLF